jgi:hypothetical protein
MEIDEMQRIKQISRLALPMSVAVAVLMLALPHVHAAEPAAHKVYELRTYTTLPGRMPALLARFRDHTMRLFEKHGMHNIGYWQPQGADGENRLIYLLAHDSKEAADKSWQAFRDDPDWKTAKEASERDGKIVEKAESVYLDPTDFSQLK